MRFSVKNDNLGLNMKILKVLGIQPSLEPNFKNFQKCHIFSIILDVNFCDNDGKFFWNKMFGNRTFNGTISERISEEPTVLIFPITFFLIWIIFLIWGALKGKILKTPWILTPQGQLSLQGTLGVWKDVKVIWTKAGEGEAGM